MRLSLYLFFKTSLKCEIINDSHLESCSSLKFPTKRFFAGDHRGEVIPVPIPNTEVKLSIAEGSAGLARARVGRRRQFFLQKIAADYVATLLGHRLRRLASLGVYGFFYFIFLFFICLMLASVSEK